MTVSVASLAQPEAGTARTSSVWLDAHHIHAHVALSVQLLLLDRTAEHACGNTRRSIRDDLKRIQLAQLLSTTVPFCMRSSPRRKYPPD